MKLFTTQKFTDNCSYYCLPMKLQEGNIFTGVYLSFCLVGFHVTITHDALDLTIQGPPSPSSSLPVQETLGPATLLLYTCTLLLWPQHPTSDIWCQDFVIFSMYVIIRQIPSETEQTRN